jgi:hypothetical protein
VGKGAGSSHEVEPTALLGVENLLSPNSRGIPSA